MSTRRQLSGDYYSQFTSTIQIPNLAKEIEWVFRLSLRAAHSQSAGGSLTAPAALGDGKEKENPEKRHPKRSIFTGLPSDGIC